VLETSWRIKRYGDILDLIETLHPHKEAKNPAINTLTSFHSCKTPGCEIVVSVISHMLKKNR
jgi:hypothetical protein